MNWDRNSLVDENRLGSNVATERYQPYWGTGHIEESPLPPHDNGAGLVSVIKRGPTGVGASFSFTEPVGANFHEVIAPEPLLSRPAGA